MDEETEVTDFPSVGERLRAARQKKKLSLEDIASETRIPLRHLESLEAADWERLPAPTYTIGFAKNYAGAIGLDRAEIAEQLRQEMGGYRTDTSTIEHFEPADPARTMPKWLVISAIAAIIVVVLIFSWIRNRSLTEEAPAPAVAERSSGCARSRCPTGRGRCAAGPAGRSSGPGRSDRHRPSLDSCQRPGKNSVRGNASARPDLPGSANGERAGPSGRRSRSASDHGRPVGRSAGRAGRAGHGPRQPGARRPDAGPAVCRVTATCDADAKFTGAIDSSERKLALGKMV